MKLEEILSVSGKPGLYKLISQSKSSFIVESLEDKKRFPVFQNNQVSSLDNISIFTEDEPVALAEVFVKIFHKENGKHTPDFNNDIKQIEQYIAEILPEYDKDRVYPKDMKKMVQWYNILLDNSYITEEAVREFSEKKDKDEEVQDKE